jgi:hypothetical protein
MKPQFARPLFLIWIAFVVATFSVLSWAEQPSHKEQVFKDDDLTDMPRLLERFEKATSEDVKWAELYVKLGHHNVSRSQWPGASKAFAEAAMSRPTPRTLLNHSVAYANTGDYGPCEEQVEGRFRIIGDAFDYFHAGLDMHKVLGPKSDLDDGSIVDFHKKMLDAQKRLLDFQRKCFDPKKTDR